MLALEADGEIVAGACNLPAIGELYLRRRRAGRILQRRAHPLLKRDEAE